MSNQKKINKVICIGMHKTGTTTLGLALLDLGYSVLGARTDVAELLMEGDVEEVLNITKSYEALQDVPWAVLYKELDKKYPNSKFIVTKRDETKWIQSVLNHFADTYIPLHDWMYGVRVASGNEDVYLKRYKQHYAEVEEYFKDRQDDLLSISFANGDDWEKICKFLGHDIPNKKFPFANKGQHNMTFFEKGYNKLRSLLPTSFRRKILDFFGFPDKRNRFNNHFKNKSHRDELKHKASQKHNTK